MKSTRWILLLACLLLVISALLLSAGAHGATTHSWDERTITRTPISCGPISCHQRKISTLFTHGQTPVTLTWWHKRPAESRDTYTTPAWEPWVLVGVHLGGQL